MAISGHHATITVLALPKKESRSTKVSFEPRKGTCAERRSSERMHSCMQWERSSEVIRGHQRSRERMHFCMQWERSSEVIRGHQRSSERMHFCMRWERQSEAMRVQSKPITLRQCHQGQSRAIKGNHLKAEQALVNLGALNPRLLICMLRIGRALGAREIDQR